MRQPVLRNGLLRTAFVAGTSVVLLGQQSAGQKPGALEVASVKVNKSGEGRASLRLLQVNGFTATNAPLTTLIASFYQKPIFGVVGGPDWIRSERFDITATSGMPLSIGEKRTMGRSLLEDRFKLKTHAETRDGRVYALVLAHEDGRLGPGLTPSALDCSALLADRSPAGRLNRFNIGEGGPPPCVAVASRRHLQGNGIQMGVVASTLGTMLRETVVDRTGLTGSFSVDMVVMRNSTTADSPDSATRANRIFVAVREQLGLKLEPTIGPVEVLVVDHVEKPTPD